MSENSRTNPVYVISVFAEIAGVHPQTLRNYERSGLLNPLRTSGGSRRFSEADLEALRRIQELTTDGVSLAGVRRILELEARLDAIAVELDLVQPVLAARRGRMRRRKARRDEVGQPDGPHVPRRGGGRACFPRLARGCGPGL